MPEPKTKKTRASVHAFLKKAAKGERYEACLFLLETFERATKEKAARGRRRLVTPASRPGDLVFWYCPWRARSCARALARVRAS